MKLSSARGKYQSARKERRMSSASSSGNSRGNSTDPGKVEILAVLLYMYNVIVV